MGRTLRRARKKMEEHPIRECEKIRKKFAPSLYKWFGNVKDPRNPSYVTYEMTEMLGTLYFKYLVGLTSMRSMTEYFDDEKIRNSLYHYLGANEKERLPHYQTVNDLLCRVNPDEIEEIIQKLDYQLIRQKRFYDARYNGKWLIIVDATTTYSGKRELNKQCQERRHKNGTEQETISYQWAILEAKIYLGNGLVASIGSEFIENHGADYERQKTMGAEAFKQDCETKAFKRLAEKIKKRFPRLPICIMGDSLYVSEPVMDLCRANNWEFLLRYKDGSAPSIAEEFENIPDKEEISYTDPVTRRKGELCYVNDIGYRKHEVHMVRYIETDKNGIKKKFQFLSSMRMDKHNAKQTVDTGRCRWKIENQGFKRQKIEAQDITHICSWNAQAMKNHYLIEQLADLIRKLYELWFLAKQGIQKTQKKISSDLLMSLYWPPTESEDTS